MTKMAWFIKQREHSGSHMTLFLFDTFSFLNIVLIKFILYLSIYITSI